MENDVRLEKISKLSQIESSDGSDVYYRLFDSLYDGLGLFELREGKVRALYLNERFFEVAGYTKEQYRPYLDNVTVTFFEEDEKRFLENALKSAGANREACFEVRGYRADGSVGWFCIRSRRVDYVKSDYPVFLATIYDCTGNKQLEQAAKLNGERYRILEEIGASYLFDYDPQSDEMIFSPGRDRNEHRFSGYARYLRGQASIHPDDSAYFYNVLLKACRRERRGYVDARSNDPKGGWVLCRLHYSSVAGDRDNVIRVLGRIDVKGESGVNDNPFIPTSENFDTLMRKESAAGISLVSERLQTCPKKVLLMLADIDGMGKINERFGFDEGSELLHRFEMAAEEIFKGGVVFRYMGDVFAVYIEGLTESELYYLTDRLRTAAENLSCGGENAGLGFSAGVAWVKECKGREHVRDFLITAAHALYRAKSEGKNSIVTENAGN
ncbi:MAG: GGDEF domain-containing protein [Oscillospiraceae bacterium]|nr:GGDEF domain-containing protein [Oscillospiraceae bacterium]